MRKYLWRILALALLVCLPVVIHTLYLWSTQLPDEITLATGPSGGQHRQMMEQLADEIREQLKLKVNLRQTDGSLMNLELLGNGEVDFALYQAGTEMLIKNQPTRYKQSTSFVANLYSEVAHVIVRDDSGIEQLTQLAGKSVAVGRKKSGDYAMSLLLLEHLGLSEKEIQPKYFEYDEIIEGFRNQTLDAAFVTIGIHADFFEQLADQCQTHYVSLPYIPAAVRHHISISPYQIPQGLYQIRNKVSPQNDIDTIAFRSQLLAREEIPDALVESVLAIALSEKFLRHQQLGELFAHGTSFAREKPEFSLHPGARHYYDPELKPLINSNFVEGMEGMRSFIVSLLIAGWLIYRWWSQRSARNAEHRLDSYIRSLLLIERKQLELDEYEKPDPEDSRKLQKLLDELTKLRQDALGDFTAHQINEDKAVDSFIGMCHALSDKINAKLTRVRFDRNFAELRQCLEKK